jgi:hypothetical protein
MSQCCGKIPDSEDVRNIRESIEDLSISDSDDPFKDPIESAKNDHDWWTTAGNHIIVFTDSDGQVNYDIVEGPDRGAHRFYDPEHQREGQTGVENPKTGERRHD